MVRMSAQERRTSVIRAALPEFARGGYDGTSTESIARRAGVSQPYLFRLFPGKRALFLAVATRCVADTGALLASAAAGLSGEEALRAMSHAYTRVIVKEPERLRMQMQVYVAVAAAEAAGDPAFGEAVRAEWLAVWATVERALGPDTGGPTTFMAYGMLVNVLVCMGFPAGHPMWTRLPLEGALPG
ncbi:TetR/AcrR family transcriptional regulator [Streptomyces sp. G-G2]|uniref:TetR/AcrR family transcriptional regulator n=1 Tax=Streptomyces sp. G-G2 TaxID=3046201 RepID=UPI0024BAAAD8|nr:TetR/AcrR family transcriptional regulator [Streptomyces sp. G-G2]MDJ0384721.1 helix-turn-helix domain-containing protein [Streptomyces sp. G-G2]